MKLRRLLMITSAVCLAAASSLPAKAADTIRVLCPVWSGFAPIMVAQDLGYFKKQNLNVSVTFEDDVPTIMAAMDRGDADMAMFTVGEYQDVPKGLTSGKIIGEIDESLRWRRHSRGWLDPYSCRPQGQNPGRIADPAGDASATNGFEKAGLSLKDVQLREIRCRRCRGDFCEQGCRRGHDLGACRCRRP